MLGRYSKQSSLVLLKISKLSYFVLELIPLRGENEFEPRPQNELIVPFKLPPLLHGSPHWGDALSLMCLRSVTF